mmetsp:Transcript_19725/g.46113  ORF Transcript_19725/g.46113 Transcript_19725/m.46113 type:complete len:508 (-) Transcript_19725:210-1733(-)
MMLRSLLFAALIGVTVGAGVEKNYTQRVDHFGTSQGTYSQRYYEQDTYFKGPGYPIFMIMGGEGAIPPEVGLFYPWVYEVLAKEFGALVVEPEHRYYGTSLPFGHHSYETEPMRLLNPQQALADAADFVTAMQRERNCTKRGTPGYCPVVTFGGSYPGFLSAMMRLRYPAVVDVGYAASAPMKFYAQEVDQFEYYKIITASAERASPNCPDAVRSALSIMLQTPVADLIKELGICTPLPAYLVGHDDLFMSELVMAVRVQFANLNMANYPPTNATGLAVACSNFVDSRIAPLEALKLLLTPESVSMMIDRVSARLGLRPQGLKSSTNGCFDFSAQVPAGPNGTLACGDWSGCGGGVGGDSWDYETCVFLVETIGTNNLTDMFPARNWSLSWLTQHCQDRFQVTPEPTALVDLWGFSPSTLLATGATNIIFTNGLNDGWSAGGFTESLSSQLLVFNMPNGAHHSDLSHSPPSPDDTPDVTDTRNQAAAVINLWLAATKGSSVVDSDFA